MAPLVKELGAFESTILLLHHQHISGLVWRMSSDAIHLKLGFPVCPVSTGSRKLANEALERDIIFYSLFRHIATSWITSRGSKPKYEPLWGDSWPGNFSCSALQLLGPWRTALQSSECSSSHTGCTILMYAQSIVYLTILALSVTMKTGTSCGSPHSFAKSRRMRFKLSEVWPSGMCHHARW